METRDSMETYEYDELENGAKTEVDLQDQKNNDVKSGLAFTFTTSDGLREEIGD